MLVFDPKTRIDCFGSMEHRYLAEYHDIAHEPIAERFDRAFCDAVLPINTWKVTIRNEIAGASLLSLCVRPSRVMLMPAPRIHDQSSTSPVQLRQESYQTEEIPSRLLQSISPSLYLVSMIFCTHLSGLKLYIFGVHPAHNISDSGKHSTHMHVTSSIRSLRISRTSMGSHAAIF
jgi:hypothetical protein